MTTTTVRGRKVLAKEYKEYGVMAYTFANRTQAERRAAEVNGQVFQFCGSRPFYVEVA